MKDLKLKLRRLPWPDILVFCAVVGTNLIFSLSLVSSNVLYLGGDTAREAWRALTFISTGHFSRAFSVPFESDLYCLLFVPFIAVFKNSILTLQASGIFFTALTVAVLYGYVRKAYGLFAAACLGALFASSPQLLAHAALGAEFSIPLWVGVILFSETFPSPRAPYVRTTLAGFFVSLHPYFLFPYFGYLAGKLDGETIARLRRDPSANRLPAARHALLFLAGLSPLLLKMAAAGFAGERGLSSWATRFAGANLERWNSVPHVLQSIVTQFSWSVSSFSIYHTVDAPALITPLFLLWVFLWAMSFSVKGSRRWAVSIAAGLIPAGIFASPEGLGMRHMLAFLPFCWLMLPPFFSRFPVRKGKYLFAAVAATVLMHNALASVSFREYAAPQGAAVLRDTARIAGLLAASPAKDASLYSDNSNLFHDLRFLVPEKDIRLFDDVTGLEPHTAILFLNATPAQKKRIKVRDLGAYYVSGRTACHVLSR